MSISYAIADTITLSKRNLKHIVRLPQLLVFTAIQPIMFTLLFIYVFGGAIKGNTHDYIMYMLPGVVVQTVLMGSLQTGISIVSDLSRGVMDRFRSLPISRAAVLNARVLTDILRNAFVVGIMVGVGFILGFRIENGILQALGAFALTLGFGVAFSWLSAMIGLWSGDIETAQSAGFIWVFPLIFASSIFVPIETMPSWLQAFAQHSPISLTADTVRALLTGGTAGDAWWQATLWIVGLTLLFGSWAIWRFRKS